MGLLKILHHYLLSGDWIEEDVATWLALQKLREKYTVIDRQVDSDDKEVDKWLLDDFIAEHWGSDDLILLEHDVEPEESMIEEMLACSHPICVQVMKLRSLLEGGTTTSLIGFCRIKKEVQLKCPARLWHRVGTEGWPLFESRLVAALKKSGCLGPYAAHLHHKELAWHNTGMRRRCESGYGPAYDHLRKLFSLQCCGKTFRIYDELEPAVRHLEAHGLGRTSAIQELGMRLYRQGVVNQDVQLVIPGWLELRTKQLSANE